METIFRLVVPECANLDRVTSAPRMNAVCKTWSLKEKRASNREADEYCVEKILDRYPDQGNFTHYQVNWYGYEELDWQPTANISEGLWPLYHSQM